MEKGICTIAEDPVMERGPQMAAQRQSRQEAE